MQILENISLKQYNTFGIEAKARFFCEVQSLEDLNQVLRLKGYPQKFILGGGSNMLITKDIDALVLFINLKGIRVIGETAQEVDIEVMAGENWHQLVLYTLSKNYGGIENLSLIPGNTGTAPIQNIGAYGVELKDVFIACEAVDCATAIPKTFSKTDCKFGYRDSFFKNEGKGKYIISSVQLRLQKVNHKLHTSYGAIEEELRAMGIVKPTIKDISNAVIRIRRHKLPDPKDLGNSGSFFKNPVLSKSAFLSFNNSYPEAPFYKVTADTYKIPAGWLIEQCGFKGKRYGDAGVHVKQALVIVNYGTATGAELLSLAERIQEKVMQTFGIAIATEVNIIK